MIWSHLHLEIQLPSKECQSLNQESKASKLISKARPDKIWMTLNLKGQLISEERFLPSKNSRVKSKKLKLRPPSWSRFHRPRLWQRSCLLKSSRATQLQSRNHLTIRLNTSILFCLTRWEFFWFLTQWLNTAMHPLRSWLDNSSTLIWWPAQPVTYKPCSQEHQRSTQIWKRMICSSRWTTVIAMLLRVGPRPTSTWRLKTNHTNKDSISSRTSSCNQLSQQNSSQKLSKTFIISSSLLTLATIGIILISGSLCLTWDHQLISSLLEPATSSPCPRPKLPWWNSTRDITLQISWTYVLSANSRWRS